MTTTTNPYPDVALPAGAHTLSDDSADDWPDKHRFAWGDARRVEATNFVAAPCAAQLADATIDTAGTVAGEPPCIFIDEVRDGTVFDLLRVSVDGARSLATALNAAVDQIDGWTTG